MKYIYDPDVLYHAGKKGMKWGYNDGKSNGNRKANDRSAEYQEDMIRNANDALQAQDKGDTAGYNKYWSKAKTAESNRDKASSVGYRVGFTAGRAARGASHAVKYAKHPIKNIKKTASKGANWIKKSNKVTSKTTHKVTIY